MKIQKKSIALITLVVLCACSKPGKLTIDLQNNDCVIYQPIDYLPSDSFLYSTSDENLEFKLLSSEGNSRILRLKNNGEASIFFLDPINIQKYTSLPKSNQGSLWINHDSESKAYGACVIEKKYSLTYSDMASETILNLTIYNGMELKQNEEFDVELKFEKSGTYRVILMYSGTKSNPKSTWGLNKSCQIVSESFTVKD